MKKSLLLLLLTAILLSALPAASVTATPVADLTALARYFPDTSPMFFAMRTDDAMLDTLDGLIARVAAKLPQGTLPPMKLRNLLDLALQSDLGSSFSEGIRPWLGDSAAAGVLSAESLNSSSPAFLLAVDITDRAAAESFWANLFERMNVPSEREAGDGYVLLRPSGADSGPGAVLIAQDALLIGNGDLTAAFGNPATANLTRSATFSETLDLLPEDDYDALAYIDVHAMSQTTSPGDPMSQVLGSAAVGLSVRDGRTVLADVAANVGDLNVVRSMGLNLMGGGPVDPNFAANIPADASLVIHTANLKGLYDLALQLAQFNAASPQAMQDSLNLIRSQVRAQTGLDLDADVLSWLTGDYALFARLDTATLFDAVTGSMSGEQPTFEELPFGFGIVIKAVDPAKARAVAGALGTVISQQAAQSGDPNMSVSHESISGVDVTVISQPLPMGQSSVPMDVVLGANDQVFVVATRSEAVGVLSGSARLDKSPAYQEASGYFLPDPTFVFYSDSNGMGGGVVLIGLTLLGPQIGNVFNNIVDELNQGTPTAEELQRREAERLRQEEQNRQMMAMFRALAGLSSSSSITATSSGDGDTVIRLAITLAE